MIVSDVGIFIVVLIFSKKVSIKDCIYYLKNVKYIKINKKEVRFSLCLKFKANEIVGKSIKLILRYKNNCYSLNIR